jgi:hypothetical protein
LADGAETLSSNSSPRQSEKGFEGKMKLCENFVCILIASAFGTFATASERNETSITTSDSSGKSDKEAHDIITALTLAAIAEEYANDTINDQTYRNVSETLLTTLQNGIENGVENRDTADISYFEKESIDPIISNDFSEEIVNEDPPSRAEDKKIIENVLLGMRAMPDNATIWELFQAQVQADFAPILIVIPRPIKRLIASNAVKIAQKLRVIVGGPMIPMFITAGRVLRVAGKSIVFIGEDILRLSNFILTTWDGNVTPEDPFSLQPGKIDDLNCKEIDLRNSTVKNAKNTANATGAAIVSNIEDTDDFIELDATSVQEETIEDSHGILTHIESDNDADLINLQEEIQSKIMDTFDDADLIHL